MRRSNAILGIIALALLGVAIPSGAAGDCSAAPHPAGEWPVYGHDLLNTRNQVAESAISPANVGDLDTSWVFSVEAAGGTGTIESAPMISGGCVFVATQTGWVFALDAADGTLVWKADLGATTTTLSVAGGRVFADVSFADAPRMVALDVNSGAKLWDQELIQMQGSDVTGSPIAFADKVATGISCIGAEQASGPARLTCRGAFVILDASSGFPLATAYAIPVDDQTDGYAGGSIWSTAAVDLETGYAYVGAGNPFSAKEHPHTNAVLKVDIDDTRPTFGTVVDSYKATGEQYLPVLGTTKPACEASDHNFVVCEFPDLDIAAAPNIFLDSRGRKLVGVGQGAGIFHTVRADTMEYVWSTVTGPPFLGTRSGGAAFDGEKLYVNGGPGIVWALDKEEGNPAWVTPTLGANPWTAQATANGVVYTETGNGSPVSALLALDAASGDTLLMHPFAEDIAGPAQSVQAGGPVVARNKVFAPVNGSAAGFIVALRLPA